ncbi:MAG: exodeoxyribonuclease VII large subunit [Synechococcus sp.]|nr:exodeoxyribonuclease VII large subunit [Synechococcus sp.]
MTADAPPTYSVRELNGAIASLLERGFAPRFLVQATASRPQVKKGHLWLTLTDGEASISAVAWASKLQQLDYVPADGEGVTVVGKLNFWAARATLAVQVLDLRPSLSTVLRRFEATKALLESEGLIDPSRRRRLPAVPARIAVLTSVPSSALADILRTAKERWPLTDLLIVPIPVQGEVADRICTALDNLQAAPAHLRPDAVVLARGGGSREDLMVFDDEQLCRRLALFPCPVVTGIGHEDDLTVADLVADHRAATPTAAIVTLLPSAEAAYQQLAERKRMLEGHRQWWLERCRRALQERWQRWLLHEPRRALERRRDELQRRQQLLTALSPQRWLSKGFAILESAQGDVIRSVAEVHQGDALVVRLHDGSLKVQTEGIDRSPQKEPSTP